jgi:hypothetical protein
VTRRRTFHEIAFGLLVSLAAFRIFYLLYYASADLRARQPKTFAQAGRLFVYGIGSFLLGFGCWNVDKCAHGPGQSLRGSESLTLAWFTRFPRQPALRVAPPALAHQARLSGRLPP